MEFKKADQATLEEMLQDLCGDIPADGLIVFYDDGFRVCDDGGSNYGGATLQEAVLKFGQNDTFVQNNPEMFDLDWST